MFAFERDHGPEWDKEAGAPAAKAGEEELATESLAEYILKQGFYDKGLNLSVSPFKRSCKQGPFSIK